MTKLMTIGELHGILISCAGGAETAASHAEIADASLDDLGYDSLALIETATRLKVDHGVVIPDEHLSDVSTLGELLGLVNERIAGTGHGSRSADAPQGEELTNPASAPSLYERLGGANGIARVMDVLVERLFDNVSANQNADVVKMHDKVSRAGFKFMVTAWSVEETGGPKIYPGKDMWAAHANMVATERDWDVVALEIAATLSFCGVPEQESKEYMAIIDSYRDMVLDAASEERQRAVAQGA
ncbi:phosphopantetheine-binding protein [Streptomyces sp. NPDC059814]|uniref:phosphopantetheine-binding protein n=1 Tax=unclassified Streptomyces TaxID=2593676 RepID=UPI00364EB0AE